MLLLGIDINTSSVKVSVVDANHQKVIATTQYRIRNHRFYRCKLVGLSNRPIVGGGKAKPAA